MAKIKYLDETGIGVIKDILDEDYTLTAGVGIEISEDNVIGLNGEAISNPNIAINTNFKKPINQRGKTEYATAGYTIDCWAIARDKNKITLTDNGIKIGYEEDNSISAPSHFFQKIENFDSYQEKTLTLSCEVTETTSVSPRMYLIYVENGESITKGVALKQGVNKVSATIPPTITGLYIWIYGADIRAEGETVNNYTTISWVKLEEGKINTTYICPLWEIELGRCQRYLQYISGYTVIPMSGYAVDIIDFVIPLSLSMRIKPSIIGDLVVCNETYAPQDGFTFSCNLLSSGHVLVRATKTEHGLTKALLRPESTIFLSAEM